MGGHYNLTNSAGFGGKVDMVASIMFAGTRTAQQIEDVYTACSQFFSPKGLQF
ncbi:hypothetical protein ABZT49_31795 [Methylobacterium sp. EM32]|uniref:hypothetical protein n=1 Tax=Methylobacterium sp. EM32 TaxID=3163481 RepID=UPI0033AB6E8D